jgi:hypothetical protein
VPQGGMKRGDLVKHLFRFDGLFSLATQFPVGSANRASVLEKFRGFWARLRVIRRRGETVVLPLDRRL